MGLCVQVFCQGIAWTAGTLHGGRKDQVAGKASVTQPSLAEETV